jgi:ribulose-bisphosphate carboxylase large chain
LRARVGAAGRALTCSALKPQGLGPDALARLAERFARGGIDFVKDDHGLADQGFSRFAERVRACAAAVRRAAEVTGHPTRYVPSVMGDLGRMRAQVAAAREAGADTVMVTPMIAGFATVQALVRENPDLAFFAHPAMGGVARIAPALLIGKLFRLIGADAVIFPTHGGRFGYSEATCRALARAARAPWHGLAPSLPSPAGGIALGRIAEKLEFYGPETMLLVGGGLLLARERLAEETLAFTRAVARHVYG